MSVRATTTHIDKYGVTHRIDLLRTGYVGASTELRGSDAFLRFSHENLSEADVFSTPIQRGRLDYGVWIDSTAQKAVIDELFLSQEGQFLVQWYIGGSLFWTGTVALDLSNFDEGAFPYRAQITAKDLTYLEGLAFPTYADPTPSNSFATRRTLISLIAECLPYGLNIVTATSWIESNIDTAHDFLRQVYLDASSLQGLNRFEALSRILSDNGCFLKQTDGVWLIEQLSAHATPSSVKRWTYDASGVYQSEATVDPRTTANTNLQVVTGSLSSVAPAYKSVQVRYDANVGKPIEIPSDVDPRLTAQIFSQQYISTYNPLSLVPQAIESVRLIATGVIKQFNASASAASKAFVDVAIRIQAGDQYVFGGYTTSGKYGWINSQASVITRAYFDGYDQATKIATYRAQVNIETDPIPAPTTATNYGRLSVTFLSSSPALQYENVKFELVQGEFANVFQLTQTGQYSSAYSKTANMGDGPRAYALTALRWQTGSMSLDKVTSQWQRRGSTDWRRHSVNLAKEVMDFQRSYARTLQVVARGPYTPSKTLVYDLTNWYYIGGSFDGYTGDWTMTFVRNSFVTSVDNLTTAGILTPSQVGVGIVAAIANTATNTTEAVGQFLLRLALPATGTISQIIVSDIDAFVRVLAGQVLRLVHPVTLQSDEVRVRADRNSGAFVDIDTVTLTADYPIGSYVFVSAQSVQAGILVGENAVRIYAEGQSLGRLTADVNGTVTSIDVNLYTRVLRGMEMRVVNSQTGAVYAVTVDQNEAGPGEVTLDIEEQVIYARAGDVVAGDNSFQQSQITVTQGLIVLKVNSNGRVAQIRLGADDLGSEIDISAEQVNINGIVFTEGTVSPAVPGDIKTSNYVAGSAGWKIDGDGTAEFNDVVVRGSLSTSNITGDLTMNGGAIKNSAGTFEIDENGLVLNGATYNAPGSSITWNNGGATEYGRLAGGDIAGAPVMALLGNDLGYIRLSVGIVDPDEEQIKVYSTYVQIGTGKQLRVIDTANSTSTTTGSAVISGGVGIAQNLHVGGTGNFTGALRSPVMNMTAITDVDSPYTVLATDTHIAVDNNANPVTINLPTGTAGRKITIFDSSGSAGIATITINRASTNTINGGTSTTLTTNYQSVTLIFNAGNWTII